MLSGEAAIPFLFWLPFLLNLLHSERPNLHRVFGLSECNRVKSRLSFVKSSSSKKVNRKSQELFPFAKMAEKHGDVPVHLENVFIALIMPFYYITSSNSCTCCSGQEDNGYQDSLK